MRILILTVMGRVRSAVIEKQLSAWGMEVLPAHNIAEAQKVFDSGLPVQVVLADEVLADGNWRNLLEIIKQRRLHRS